MSWPAQTILASRYESKIDRIVRDVARRWGLDVDTLALLSASRDSDADRVVIAMRPGKWGKVLVGAVRPVMVSAYRDGAKLGADRLGVERSVAGVEKASFRVVFDTTDALAVQWAEAHAAELVVGSAELREMVRGLIVQAMHDRISHRDLARILRGVIGLDPRRAAALQRFMASLAEQGVPTEQIGKRSQRYASALLSQRAKTIARTEAAMATSAGQQAAWEESIQQGILRPSAMRKKWLTTDDELLCRICEALDGKTVGINDVFPGGHKGPPAHPNCRCATGLVSRRV